MSRWWVGGRVGLVIVEEGVLREAEWRVCKVDKCGPLIFSQPVCRPLHWLFTKHLFISQACNIFL